MATETIEHAIQAAIDAGKINGAIICATSASGDFTYTTALGQRTLLSGEKRPQQPTDILYLASATKLITTIAALQCVEDGLLTLTDPLSPVAPDLASLQVLESDSAPDTLVPPKRPITLSMLLSHTSGLSYHFFVPRVAAYRERHDAPFPDPASGKLRRPVEEAFSYPLAAHPGRALTYGPNLDWAGRIVERVTGMRLGEHVRARIAKPLGIDGEEVQFYPVQGEAVKERMVDLNPDDPQGTGRAVVGGDGEANKRSEGDFGGHGLFMTAEGYLRVLRSLLANDGRLLRRETVEKMFENQIGAEAEEGFRAALTGPLGWFFRLGMDVETKLGHGLGGLLTLEDVKDAHGEGTLTWGGGLTFAWFVDRKKDLCGLAAIQASLPVDGAAVAGLKQTFRYDIYRKQAAWNKHREHV